MKVAGQVFRAGIVAAAALCGAAHAQPQDYPNKLVKFIVTYPPGGSSDVMARIIGQKLTEYWGQLVLVDSRPGADGSIGMEYAARQPDGVPLFFPISPLPTAPTTSTGFLAFRRTATPFCSAGARQAGQRKTMRK